MKTSYNYLQDPGHGWLAVPVKDLHELGLVRNDFSPYSYVSRSGSTVYLEEDFDASFYVEVYKAALGQPPHFHEKHTNNRSFIRSLEPLRSFHEYNNGGRNELFARREGFWKLVENANG